ncbi:MULTISPECIES: hypothetical protein [unclassified Mesorhizobium]|uniref:hypothetical protein n=1 Tax=unclassified Mesorhizobium TaxID=325217 RepID=UPI000FDA8449|nr:MULTISPECIES: hypothetical protein [unclassified Mesorhizobium]TGQ04885.1 hypothetical protein EN862_031880 [Mesorhizobium sp. M2E.F.Ca.ET.219.01.1.1]TGT65406.1 hypothetical protein EN809_031620 [Mesorhizobium sp. M2E.F.Ca.ET.166.01.1.1]TGV97452.1 hypothetical protein EN797_031630 [Mesorhizobium sp. M2E.F.Ca.ET.154.01.1.1]
MAKKSISAARQLFPAIANALLDLPPTRAGFEGFVAALIDAATGGRLALMSSGDQAGVDGVTLSPGFAPRRAMQAKRYAEGTALDQSHLLGEMDRAEQRFAGLDCWVLASTKTIHGKEQEELKSHAERKGWGLVVLDWSLLAGLPRLAILCAAHRKITDCYLTDVAARAELSALTKTNGYQGALKALVRDLAAADVGFEPAREAAASQMDAIFSDRFTARKLAGASPTFLSQAPPVVRANVDRVISEWWSNGRTALALLGDEGAGKTWAALMAMRTLGAIAGGPITVVIPSDTAAKANDGLTAVIEALAEIAKRAGSWIQDPLGFWSRRLRLWTQGRTDGGPQPRLLVLVDGLDELDPFNWDRWFASLLEARMAGLVRIIVACRRDDWQRWAKLNDLQTDQLHEFSVPHFQPGERDEFLRNHKVDISQVSKQVLEAALHPRTAFHVTRLGTEIGDFKRITRELILLRDFQNRYELKRGPLDPDAFKNIVIRMAREAEAAVLAHKPFTASARNVIDHAVEVTGHEPETMRRVLSELISGGWVQRSPGSPHDLTFTDKALPLAVGLALANEIQSRPVEVALGEVSRLLQPWEADDLIEPVLRTCATVLITQGASLDLCRDILRRWGSRQFHSLAAQDFWRRLHVFRPELFLELLETGATGSGWLGEWGVASLWEDQPECVDLVEARLQQWLTRIGLPRHRTHSDAKFEAFTNRERSRQLRRLKALERRGEDGWLDLLGTEVEPKVAPFYRAVRTIGFLPRASFVPSIVAWAISVAVSGRPYGVREIAALLRDNPFDWKTTVDAIANTAGALIALNSGLGRSAAALLLEATGRPEDAIRATELRPGLAAQLPKPLLLIDGGELFFGPAARGSDRALAASLVDFAANPDLALSGTVRAEFDRILSNLDAGDIGGWLDGERPLIVAPLRWAQDEALAKIKAFIDAGPPETGATAGLDFATVAQKVFPVLSSSQTSQAADRIESQGTERGNANLIALRMLPLSFSNQLALLTTQDMASWPHGVDTLLREPTVEEYLEQIDTLDFAGPTEPLKTKLHLLSKINERYRPECEARKVDWSQAFTHADNDIRTLSLDLADAIGGQRASRQLAATGWSSQDLPPIPAYEGSSVLGALPDVELLPLGSRLNGEYCLRLLHQRPGLRAAAEAGIWRWIAATLETARTSHSIGGTWCHYGKRDEAFAEFVAHDGEKVYQVLAKVWADHSLRNNLLYGDWDGPGWPLLKALAPQQPNFVKQIWREAVTHGRGFSSSLTSSFPTDLPPGPDFDDVRLEMLEAVHTDEGLFGYVRALQRKGHLGFVKDLVAERFNGEKPYDRAWAMTLAGFLIPTDGAEAIWREHLSRSPAGGWLAQVYETSRRSFDSALHMRHWCSKLVEAVSEEDAWCAFRLAQLNADDRYADLMGGPPFLFKNKDSRVSWLNFLASEGHDARKKVRQALGNTWLRGPRYQDTINGR